MRRWVKRGRAGSLASAVSLAWALAAVAVFPAAAWAGPGPVAPGALTCSFEKSCAGVAVCMPVALPARIEIRPSSGTSAFERQGVLVMEGEDYPLLVNTDLPLSWWTVPLFLGGERLVSDDKGTVGREMRLITRGPQGETWMTIHSGLGPEAQTWFGQCELEGS